MKRTAQYCFNVTVVHFVNPADDDMTLCGHSLNVSDMLNCRGEPTNEPVTCEECIEIYNACRRSKKNPRKKHH